MTNVKKQIALREAQTGHSVMGPSSLKRIIACPASAFESLKAPPSKESRYARRGSFLHHITEHYWPKADHVVEALEAQPVGIYCAEYKDLDPLDHQEVGWLLDCRDYLREIIADLNGAEPQLEEKVSLVTWGIPEVWGTADVNAHNNDILHVVDWKFGSGVAVFPEGNPQTRAYAAGVTGYPSMIKEVHIHIVQPPLNIFESEVLTYEQLKTWVFDELSPAINLARQDDAPYIPGEEQCRWCPAGMTCRARRDAAHADAETIFSQFVNASIDSLGTEELVQFYHMAGTIVTYRDQIAKYLMKRLQTGKPVPGMKLVSGRSTRKWRDMEDAFHYLKNVYKVDDEKLYTKKPISPAAAEKLDRKLKKDDDFQALIDKPPGNPQMVQEDDPRPALDQNVEAVKAFTEFKTATE